MAYRLKLDETPHKSLRKILRDQCALARRRLAGAGQLNGERAVAVHDVRRALKRARALLVLLGPALGWGTTRRLDRRFRDVGRMLAGARDRDVLKATLAALARAEGAQRPLDTTAALARLAAGDKAPGKRGRTAASPFRAADRLLAAAEAALARAPRRKVEARAIVRCATRTYAKGRDALDRARAAPSDEAFHDLRKCVQRHWRHCQLLQPIWPEELDVRGAAAKQLSQLLGDDHDLALLKEFARGLAVGECGATVDPAGAIIAAAERCQTNLRCLLLPRAARLFAERPKAFGRRLLAYWQSAERIAELADATDVAPSPPQGANGNGATARPAGAG